MLRPKTCPGSAQLAPLALVILVAVTGCGRRPEADHNGAAGAPALPAPAGEHPAPRASAHARAFQVMGTEAVFTVWTDDPDKAEQAFTAAYAEIRRIEELMTDWEHPGQPPSDVVRINAAAGKAAVPVSDETLQVIDASLDMSRRSDGAFDITYAAMRGLWKFDEDLEKKIPPASEIERRRQLINYRDVVVDAKKRTVKLRRAGMRLGLGGIAKGYAVDRCAEVLRRHGFDNFMVQAGGDLFVSGSKGGAPWMVGVRDPRGGPRAIIAKMAIRDHAFSTAGDYERAFVLDGKRYPPHHRPQDRLPGDGVARRDHLRADRVPGRRARRRGLHPRARAWYGPGRFVSRLLDDDRRRQQQGVGVEVAGGQAATNRTTHGGALRCRARRSI